MMIIQKLIQYFADRMIILSSLKSQLVRRILLHSSVYLVRRDAGRLAI